MHEIRDMERMASLFRVKKPKKKAKAKKAKSKHSKEYLRGYAAAKRKYQQRSSKDNERVRERIIVVSRGREEDARDWEAADAGRMGGHNMLR